MPDSKITALASIGTGTDPAVDPLVIVDVSDTTMAASGTTKKVTLNNLLACSPTATLASATITGNLTVDTNTFFVDSANNRVGVGTASPQQNLHVFGTGTQTIAVERDGATIAGRFEFVSGNSTNLVRCVTAKDLVFEQATGTEVYRIAANGVATWSNVGGVAGTAMTLNSTGLGIGTTILGGQKLAIGSSSDTSATANGFNIISNRATIQTTCNGAVDAAGTTINYSYANGGQGPLIFRNASVSNVMTLDASGNVGIGVTPSAWAIGKIIQLSSASGSFLYGAGGQAIFGVNAYYDTAWKYGGTGAANYYQQSSGIHSWFNAPSGTAGNAITWTQAMTLESTGSLVLGAAAVATTATDGFLYIPGCAGTPTGTPTAKTGRVPLVVDTTNNKLYFYSGGAWVAAN